MKKKILWIVLAIIIISLIIVGAAILGKGEVVSDKRNNEIENSKSEHIDYIYNNETLTELGEFVATVAGEATPNLK